MNASYLRVACLLSCQFILNSDCQCSYEKVRLFGGSGDYEGNVQVCIDGTWGYVCDNSWDNNDASVVCKQLGYSAIDANYQNSSYYGYGNGIVWLDEMHCVGSEDKLMDCYTTIGIGETRCGYDEIAGVYCPTIGLTSYCSEGDTRFSFSKYGRSEGRVEVCYNGEWGTVCNHGWDSTDATVACKQLGYQGFINNYTDYKYYGSGSGPIWFSDMKCNSSHTSLFSCDKSLNTTDCAHYNDVGVRCYSRDTSSCSNGDVKLWSAYDSTPDNEGIVLVCKNSTWYPLHDGSGHHAAEIVCNVTGNYELEYYRTNGGLYYGYYFQEHYQYWCNDSSYILSDCNEMLLSKAYYHSSLAVRCKIKLLTHDGSNGSAFNNQISLPACNDGSARLTNGSSQDTGRVEVCVNERWSAVCAEGWDDIDGRVVCQQLGYGVINQTCFSGMRLVPQVYNYSRGDLPIAYSNFACKGWEYSVSDCFHVNTPTCSLGHIAGLSCNLQSDCDLKPNDRLPTARLIALTWSCAILIVVVAIFLIVVIKFFSYRIMIQKSRKKTSTEDFIDPEFSNTINPLFDDQMDQYLIQSD